MAPAFSTTTKPPPAKGGGFCAAKRGGIVSAPPDLSLLCVKGGGTPLGVTEGLSLLSFSMICKSADLLYNPSVNFVDSSLCTREPNRNSLLCVKGGGTPLGVTEELVLLSFCMICKSADLLYNPSVATRQLPLLGGAFLCLVLCDSSL